jgi:drug/metabolite transporter (DMT)-like permease
MTSAAVLSAAVLHASWNALAKGTVDRFGLFVRMNIISLVVTSSALFFVRGPACPSVPWLAASALIHVVYSLALLFAYRLGDFNLTYPIARGLGPVLVAAVAIAVGQRLSASAATGLAITSASVCFLGLTPWRAVRANRPAVFAAIATGFAIAGYTLVDGFGVRRSDSAIGYTLAMSAVQAIVTCGVFCVPGIRRRLTTLSAPTVRRRPEWRIAGAATVMSLTAYGLVLFAQTRGQLAAVAALRESSTVFAAVIGWLVFKESMSRSRVAASGAIAVGAALLALAGAS